jgi:hypothetical protein
LSDDKILSPFLSFQFGIREEEGVKETAAILHAKYRK